MGNKELVFAVVTYRVCFRLSTFEKNHYLMNSTGKLQEYTFTFQYDRATMFHITEWVDDAVAWIKKNYPTAEIFIEESHSKTFKFLPDEILNKDKKLLSDDEKVERYIDLPDDERKRLEIKHGHYYHDIGMTRQDIIDIYNEEFTEQNPHNENNS